MVEASSRDSGQSAQMGSHPDEEEPKKATPEERRTFLEQWADQNPLGTIEAARQSLKETFGESISTKAISSIMRNARRKMEERAGAFRAQESADNLSAVEQSHELPAMRTPMARTVSDSRGIAVVSELEHLAGPAFYQALGNLLQKAGLRRVEVKKDGTVSVDFDI